MTNIEKVSQVFQSLYHFGVREFCVCPAARNSPWVVVLSKNTHLVKVYFHFEERSAAFFSLGRIQESGNPVAVVTTSGTAVGELLPATMEAHYSGAALILITADRPSQYRGSGAPQAAEQVGIFGVYVQKCFDLEAELNLDLESLVRTRPVHINMCFDEPLIDSGIPLLKIETDLKFEARSVTLSGDTLVSFMNEVRVPFVLVGMLSVDERGPVTELLLRLNCPVFLETTSGLREEPRLSHLQVFLADRIFDRMKKTEYFCDGIIRLGGVPTPRVWRDLDIEYTQVRVVSLSALGFSGLGRSSVLIQAPLELSCRHFIDLLESMNWNFNSKSFDQLREVDRGAVLKLNRLLDKEVRSEQGLIYALSKVIPLGSQVYLGNSLPIREWDLAATYKNRNLNTWASRGLNGIDGQVSTFLGFSSLGKSNWAILGDLTTLYDLAGPWILSQLKDLEITLVIINNGGGKIFSRMFPQKEFQNEHKVGFKSWAELWDIDYQCLTEVLGNLDFQNGVFNGTRVRIIEIQPEEEATRRFLESYKQLL